MPNNVAVQFQLDCFSRHDEQANIKVGYIPALRIYSQGHNDTELEQALISAASMFIITCYERGILEKTLKDRGMIRATAERMAVHGPPEQFISVTEQARFDRQFKVEVPINLVAAQYQEELTGCPQ